jgi:hypothetical protein
VASGPPVSLPAHLPCLRFKRQRRADCPRRAWPLPTVGPPPLVLSPPDPKELPSAFPTPPSSPVREPPKTESYRFLNVRGDILSTPGRRSSPGEAKGTAVHHCSMSAATFALLIDWVLPHQPHPSTSDVGAYRRRRGSLKLPRRLGTPLSRRMSTPHHRQPSPEIFNLLEVARRTPHTPLVLATPESEHLVARAADALRVVTARYARVALAPGPCSRLGWASRLRPWAKS